MNRPPLIGLPGRRIASDAIDGWPQALHGLEVDMYLAGYALGVLEAGGLPVHIPLDVAADDIIDHLDGLVLTGGADVEPARYGAAPHPELMTPEPDRDRLEFELLAIALERTMPVLGVCRGLQVINVAQGGTLEQHVPEHLRFDVPYTETVHEVRTVEGSELHQLYGESFSVNSLHHQVVQEVGRGLEVTARAADGTVEGLEMGADVLAVQWHPEMLSTRSSDPSLRWLVERARSCVC